MKQQTNKALWKRGEATPERTQEIFLSSVNEPQAQTCGAAENFFFGTIKKSTGQTGAVVRHQGLEPGTP